MEGISINEHALAKKFGEWLGKLERAGAPLWYRKIHGSAYMAGIPDFLLCCGGIFVAIELKNPEDPKPPTPKQDLEIRRIHTARGVAVVLHELAPAQRAVLNSLAVAGWNAPPHWWP